MKILIVDDEKIILEKLKMYISQIFTEKENIFTSDNAAKALEIISSQQPDIILTDIRMPGKDGLYISSFVHNNFPDKIVILITGFSDFKYAQTAIKNHVFDYILKPVDENVLKESVLKAIHTITERKNQAIMRKKYESYLKENIRNLQKDFLNGYFSGTPLPFLLLFMKKSPCSAWIILKAITFYTANVLQQFQKIWKKNITLRISPNIIFRNRFRELLFFLMETLCIPYVRTLMKNNLQK